MPEGHRRDRRLTLAMIACLDAALILIAPWFGLMAGELQAGRSLVRADDELAPTLGKFTLLLAPVALVAAWRGVRYSQRVIRSGTCWVRAAAEGLLCGAAFGAALSIVGLVRGERFDFSPPVCIALSGSLVALLEAKLNHAVLEARGEIESVCD